MFVQNSPIHLSQFLMHAALDQIGYTACCITYLIDTQLPLWRTWLRKKQVLIYYSLLPVMPIALSGDLLVAGPFVRLSLHTYRKVSRNDGVGPRVLLKC